jgi:RNA polymerase sigma-70 factor, ECF subfamily
MRTLEEIGARNVPLPDFNSIGVELRLSAGKETKPMVGDEGKVTVLLKEMRAGNRAAENDLLPLVYHELHRLAQAYMRRERPDHTLQPTALIHEAYLRLAGEDVDWKNREHFIGVAAHVMRRVLVDHARAHRAAIRGGDRKRVDLDEGVAVSAERSDEVLLVDGALERLAKTNLRQARVVELRYFGGLSMEEVAAVLSISVRSAKRDWALARIWLFRELHPQSS